MARADLDKNAASVAAMFDEVAAGYDRTRVWLWLRRMDAWGRHTAVDADARPGRLVLDVAAGTGTSSAILAGCGAQVVACDFSRGMLTVGRTRHPELHFVGGDALALPFATGRFDVVTISFGLRNVVDNHQVLAEMLRVTRPGGRCVVCEFSLPVARLARAAFRRYLCYVVPFIAKRVSSNPDAYRYLAESIQAWPPPAVLANRIRAAGWQDVTWHSLDGGVVVIHQATAPLNAKV